MKLRLVLWAMVIVLLPYQGSRAGVITIPGDENGLLAQAGILANETAVEKLSEVLITLAKKHRQYKREADFIEYLYYFTHRKLLKQYQEYPTLTETLTQGNYDCLTATAVYAILLSELAIPHAVVETNYHIYLLVYPGTENEILLEPTDPQYGLVTDKEIIARQKQTYLQANKELREGQVDLQLNIERQLTGQELIGLLYYNQSVRELNLGHYQQAGELAREARKFYPDSRVEKLIGFIESI